MSTPLRNALAATSLATLTLLAACGGGTSSSAGASGEASDDIAVAASDDTCAVKLRHTAHRNKSSQLVV